MPYPYYVFDAYGTLFDVHSAAARYQDEIGADWERLSQIWRAKHLEYTWIHAQTGRHTTFCTAGRAQPRLRHRRRSVAYRRACATS